MSSRASGDAAWVRVETPLAPAALADFIADLERLFRVNSLLEIHRWEGSAEGRIALEGFNLSNGRPVNSELWVDRIDQGLRVNYSNLLKRSTSFQVTPDAGGGSILIVTDDYSGTPKAERRQRLDEVDRSLNQWGRDLHSYLKSWHRWSWLRPWRWYMHRVWQPMKPSARRITRGILWVSFGEMLVVLLLVTILVIEQ